jgi:DNA-binding transcriptional MerR regulator
MVPPLGSCAWLLYCYINSCYNQEVPTTSRRNQEKGRENRAPAEVRLTVDQLARLAGTTTRNIRAFQTLGLLPRPTLSGRTGLYGTEHLDRLRAILRLQQAGFSLGALGALFAAWEQGLTLAQVLGLPAATDDAGPAGEAIRDGEDELAAFDDWPWRRSVDGLAVVPTTLLDQRAS